MRSLRSLRHNLSLLLLRLRRLLLLLLGRLLLLRLLLGLRWLLLRVRLWCMALGTGSRRRRCIRSRSGLPRLRTRPLLLRWLPRSRLLLRLLGLGLLWLLLLSRPLLLGLLSLLSMLCLLGLLSLLSLLGLLSLLSLLGLLGLLGLLSLCCLLCRLVLSLLGLLGLLSLRVLGVLNRGHLGLVYVEVLRSHRMLVRVPSLLSHLYLLLLHCDLLGGEHVGLEMFVSMTFTRRTYAFCYKSRDPMRPRLPYVHGLALLLVLLS